MTFQLLIVLAALIWLASLASLAAYVKPLWLSVLLSLLALAIGYLGLTRFQVNASKTVNSHVQWSFNSHWFFITTIVLAVLSLAYSIWKHRRTSATH
ncbi:MAG TPA: hypothetical protein VHC44_07085 [Verrucomicrobiae bacterium]|nr:hypothetical protein [Verrucomicrobiae bacterium]